MYSQETIVILHSKARGEFPPKEAPAISKVSEGIPGFGISLGRPRGVLQHIGGVYLRNVWKRTYQVHQRTPGSHDEEDGGGKRISCPQSPKWISPAFRHAMIHCLPILIKSTTGCVISRNHMFHCMTAHVHMMAMAGSWTMTFLSPSSHVTLFVMRPW